MASNSFTGFSAGASGRSIKAGFGIDPPITALVYDKTKLRKIVRAALQEIVADARNRVPVVNQKRKRSTVKRRFGGKAWAPDRLTDSLRRSIKAKVASNAMGGQITAIFYDRFLEIGTAQRFTKKGFNRGMVRQRPIIEAAIEDRAASIGKRIQDSIVQDIAFKK